MSTSVEGERRYYYADIVPYDMPERLEDLTGPTSGIVTVHAGIDPSPRPVYDLTDPSRRVLLYQRVVRAGSRTEQEQMLDRAILIEVWPQVYLPARCRNQWEERFPELRR